MALQETLILKVTHTVVVKVIVTEEVTVSPAESVTAVKSHQTPSFSFNT